MVSRVPCHSFADLVLASSWSKLQTPSRLGNIEHFQERGHHVITGREEQLHRPGSSAYIADCIGDVLFGVERRTKLSGTDDMLRYVIRQFFRESSGVPACVSVLAERIPFSFRYPQEAAVSSGLSGREKLGGGTFRDLGERPKTVELPRLGKIVIDKRLQKKFRLSYRESGPGRPHIVQRTRDRAIELPNPQRRTRFRQVVLFAADPIVDRELIRRVHVPAEQGYLQDKKLRTPTIVLGRTSGFACSDQVAQVAIALRPEDGAVITMSSDEREFGSFLLDRMESHVEPC